MPASVIEFDELSREIVKTKRDNAKLVDHNNDLVKELKDVPSMEGLVCDNLLAASACITTLKVQVKGDGAKYAKVV